MKWILKQTAWLLASIAVLYVIILGVSLVVVPMHDQKGGLETRRAPRTLYMTEPKYFFLARTALRSEADRLILLATRPGGAKLERKLHRRFAAARSHGEWFRPTRELLAYIGKEH